MSLIKFLSLIFLTYCIFNLENNFKNIPLLLKKGFILFKLKSFIKKNSIIFSIKLSFFFPVLINFTI